MKQFFQDFSNSVFDKVVKAYAFERGAPIQTMDDQYYMLKFYIDFAITRN